MVQNHTFVWTGRKSYTFVWKDLFQSLSLFTKIKYITYSYIHIECAKKYAFWVNNDSSRAFLRIQSNLDVPKLYITNPPI